MFSAVLSVIYKLVQYFVLDLCYDLDYRHFAGQE
jgi:hypothetical protein